MKHEHDGGAMPSVNQRTDAETVVFPKIGETFENDQRDERPDEETIIGK